MISLAEAQTLLDTCNSLFAPRARYRSPLVVAAENVAELKGSSGSGVLGGFRALSARGSFYNHVKHQSHAGIAVAVALAAAVASVARHTQLVPLPLPMTKKPSRLMKKTQRAASCVEPVVKEAFAYGDFMLDDGDGEDDHWEYGQDLLINDLVPAESFSFGDARILGMKKETVEDSVRLRRISSLDTDRDEEPDTEHPDFQRETGAVFAFSDFAVELENDLDDAICEEINSKRDLSSDVDGESEMFVFGDFTVGKAKAPEKSVSGDCSELAADMSSEKCLRLSTIAPARRRVQGGIQNHETKLLPGHSARVKCLSISASEQILITTSSKSTMVVALTFYGEEVQRYFGHQDIITSSLISNDDKLLVTTSRDNTMIVWDLATARQLSLYDHPMVVTSCTFSKNSHYVVTGCQDWQCRLFCVKGKRAKKSIVSYREHTSVITSVFFEMQGETVVSASADTTVQLWNAAMGEHLFTFSGHRNTVLSAQLSNSGKIILSNDVHDVILWSWHSETKTGVSITRIPAMPEMFWSLSCFAPGLLGSAYFAAAHNGQKTGSILLFEMEECFDQEDNGDGAVLTPYLTLYTKAPVHALTRSKRHSLMYGDLYGNVYLTVLNRKFYHYDIEPRRVEK